MNNNLKSTNSNEKKLKICILTDSFLPGVGGTEKAVLGLSENLSNIGQDVLVGCPEYHCKYEDAFNFKVARAKSLKITKNDNYAFPNLTRNFKKKIKDFNPNIIHCQSISPMANYGIKYAKKHKIPVIFTVHTKFKEAFSRSIKSKFIVNLLIKNMVKKLNKANKVFTVSNDMKQELLSYGYKQNVDVIRNGAMFKIPNDLEQLKQRSINLYNLHNKKNIFLFVGHIVKFKNLQFLLDALKIVKENKIDFTMLFVGSGLDDDFFKNYTKKLHLEDNVIFTGQITDNTLLSSIFSVATLYLFPSTFDNDSLTIVEAAVHRVPTLAIEYTGSSERIENNVSGFTSKNDINSYSSRIIKIINQKDKLKEVGLNAQKMIPKSWKQTAEEYFNIYNILLKDKNNGK